MPIVGEVRARAFSSIANLGWGLDVLGVCVTAAHDDVVARPARQPAAAPGVAAITITGPGAAGIPTDPIRNTAGLAVNALLRSAGRGESVELDIVKGTRPGSGLGSSSASAAAAVVAVDALLGLRVPRERLVACAARGEVASAGAGHADNVAASICGGFVIVSPESDDRAAPADRAADDRPPRLVALGGASNIRFVVVTPDVVVTTSQARARLPAQVDLAAYTQGCARAAMIAAAIRDDDPAALGAAVEGSWVDQRRAALIPGFDAVCAAARGAGAAGVMIAGSGPTIAAVVANDDAGARVVRATERTFSEAGVKAAARLVAIGPPASVVENRS